MFSCILHLRYNVRNVQEVNFLIKQVFVSKRFPVTHDCQFNNFKSLSQTEASTKHSVGFRLIECVRGLSVILAFGR